MKERATRDGLELELAPLIPGARAGDLDAFEAIVRRMQGPVRGFVRRMLRNADDSDDAAQEVFVRVWKGLAHYDARGRFVAWVFAIARNVCLDELRRQIRTPVLSDLEHIAAPDAVEVTDLRLVLERAISALPENYRSTLLLRKAGLSYEEVAQALGRPVGTVRWRLHEAKRQLALALRPEGAATAHPPITGGEE